MAGIIPVLALERFGDFFQLPGRFPVRYVCGNNKKWHDTGNLGAIWNAVIWAVGYRKSWARAIIIFCFVPLSILFSNCQWTLRAVCKSWFQIMISDHGYLKSRRAKQTLRLFPFLFLWEGWNDKLSYARPQPAGRSASIDTEDKYQYAMPWFAMPWYDQC